ncbi:MAG: electron transfer flavoprotein subunit beta/FixA family protein [Desulfobacteraceae bacterium]|nr:electron transfer flavoprotein subunit beta/FixA family protein [Desulfobacteraceae bacterium]
MNVIVCVKAVPDPKEICKIRIDPATKTLLRCDVPLVINPLDKNALEAALLLKEGRGASVTVISMGPPPAETIVKECMALGADRGILLSDRAFGGADAFATAYTLAGAIVKAGEYDLILCGMASSDGATEWVGPQIATFLGIPAVTMVRKFESQEGAAWRVLADWQNGYRRVEVRLPALLTITRDLNRPRALSFSGILKSRKKTIEQWGREFLDLPSEALGAKGSPTIVSEMSTVRNRRDVKMLRGTIEEKADQLVGLLAESGVL